ncbi:MAG: beta-ketoacyl-[acyl-carrier-protein] synthase family protein [Burkholderiales bacterium]|nr:beta-ketoacyl-[acyl-carrier-protein] synthase family protein [Burkholderiales bacterium]
MSSAPPARRRVAITGLGAICPLGATPDAVWSELVAGRSAVDAVAFTNPATDVPLVIPAAAIPETWHKPLDRDASFMTDKFTRLALMASEDAIADAGLDFTREDRGRCGTSTASCMSGITETDVAFRALYVDKRPKVHPYTLLRTMANAPAFFLSMRHELTGPSLSTEAACSSSSVAIGEAARQIQHGYADVMIAGGAETLLTYAAVNCWKSAQLLAALHANPAKSCRPFDATRAGTALGEGAIYVVLEEWERARARGARIHAELVGYACTTDCFHPTQPSVEGQRLPMSRALHDAGLPPSSVGYIHAHGTGTRANDTVETQAIKAVLGDHARRVAISSSKGAIGHLAGAAGAFGFLVCVKALQTATVPPTANLDTPDPECDLDYVPNVGREARGLGVAMSNAFGFGGTAASLIVAVPQA